MFKNLFKKPVKPIPPETVYFSGEYEYEYELPLLTGVTEAHARGLLVWLANDATFSDELNEWLDTGTFAAFFLQANDDTCSALYDAHIVVHTQVRLAHQIAQANGKTLNDWMVEL